MLDPAHVVTPSAEPAFCPSCELRHTRRADWLCPRCGMPVDAGAPRRRARPAPPRAEGFPGGSRIAGAVMLVSGAALGTVLARFPGGDDRWPLLAAGVILAVLGLGSLLKLPLARWAAVAAAVVATVVLSEDLIRERLPELMRDPLPPALRAPLRALLHPLHPLSVLLVLGFLAGALVLLVGRPRRARVAVGALLAAPLVVVLVLRALGR